MCVKYAIILTADPGHNILELKKYFILPNNGRYVACIAVSVILS